MLLCSLCRGFSRYSVETSICETCSNEPEFENYIAEELFNYGKRIGFVEGVRVGIHHTIYNIKYNISESNYFWIPQEAYLDRLAYSEGYEYGFTTGYGLTYQLHRKVIEELKKKHNNKECILVINKILQPTPIFEPFLIRKILTLLN